MLERWVESEQDVQVRGTRAAMELEGVVLEEI
jgi:hypothetical protein